MMDKKGHLTLRLKHSLLNAGAVLVIIVIFFFFLNYLSCVEYLFHSFSQKLACYSCFSIP